MPVPFTLSGWHDNVLGHSLKAIGNLRGRESIGVVRLDLEDEVDTLRNARPHIVAGGLYHAALDEGTARLRPHLREER